jgi:hypothetical protein
LKREERHEADGDAVQLTAIALLEGGVEQMADDLWKCEPDGSGDEQTGPREDEPAAVRTEPGQQPA